MTFSVDVKYVAEEGEMDLPVEFEISDPLNSAEVFAGRSQEESNFSFKFKCNFIVIQIIF